MMLLFETKKSSYIPKTDCFELCLISLTELLISGELLGSQGYWFLLLWSWFLIGGMGKLYHYYDIDQKDMCRD